MSYSLNSLEGIMLGTMLRVIKRDIRSLDYSSYGCAGAGCTKKRVTKKAFNMDSC